MFYLVDFLKDLFCCYVIIQVRTYCCQSLSSDSDCNLFKFFRTNRCYEIRRKSALSSSYNITSPQGPRVHLPVTYFLFRDTTFHFVLALCASLRPKYGTPYLFTSAIPKHTLPSDVILRRTTFAQPILPPSGPCNAP